MSDKCTFREERALIYDSDSDRSCELSSSAGSAQNRFSLTRICGVKILAKLNKNFHELTLEKVFV